MHRERQPSSLASPFNHASNAHAAERLTALIDEDVGSLNPFSLLLPVQELETVHLIPLQVVDAISAALEPADDDGPLRQVNVVPAQIASFRHTQTVPVDDQVRLANPGDHAGALERGQQLVHLAFGQMLPDPVGIVPTASLRATGRITNNSGLPKPYDFARHFRASR